MAGEPYAVQGDRTYVLSRRLPGSTFSDHHAGAWEAGATACGEALARLHRSLRSFPRPHLFLRLDLSDFVAEIALPAIGGHPDAFPLDSVRQIGEEVAGSLSSPCASAVEQLVHRDPNPSNILLKDGAVTGIVDFGVVVTCLRLLDPCYLAMSMLAGSGEDPEKRRAWPCVLRAIMRGYARHLEVSAAEHRIIFPVLAAVQFIFIDFDLKLGNIGAARRNAELLRWLSDRRAEL
jgi:Ser/Thr protein kinase RdoA (MazF antagonist)